MTYPAEGWSVSKRSAWCGILLSNLSHNYPKFWEINPCGAPTTFITDLCSGPDTDSRQIKVTHPLEKDNFHISNYFIFIHQKDTVLLLGAMDSVLENGHVQFFWKIIVLMPGHFYLQQTTTTNDTFFFWKMRFYQMLAGWPCHLFQKRDNFFY